jgi:hypothetical protein
VFEYDRRCETVTHSMPAANKSPNITAASPNPCHAQIDGVAVAQQAEVQSAAEGRAVDLQQFALTDQVPMVTGLNRSGCGLRRLHALLRSRSDSTSSGSPEISLEIRRVPRHGLAATAIAPSGRPWTSGAKGCNAPTRHVEQSLVTQISGDGEPMFNTMANRCIH